MTKEPEPRFRLLSPASLEQLKTQAKELLHAFRNQSAEAVGLFDVFHPKSPTPNEAKLSDAQVTLARSYDFASWPRLKRGVELFNALWADDPESVLGILEREPSLLVEPVNGKTSNWGPPLACAAQLGSTRCVKALVRLPGQDIQWALDRAVLKGKTEIAQILLAGGAELEPGLAMGPCETLNFRGLTFLDELGVPLADETGDPLAPVAMVLEGYFRDPPAKHQFLEFFAANGIELPDTPAMALHRGRIDLLKSHLGRDPGLLQRHFTYRDIYPLELGCHEDEGLGLHGAPLDGATLLHMAVDFDEIEVAKWLLVNGADPNARTLLDANGFGGHTPLFNLLVSQAYRSGRQRDGKFLDLLLKAGADPEVTANIRKAIRFHSDEGMHEYCNVTPIEFGQKFHAKAWVSQVALRKLSASS